MNILNPERGDTIKFWFISEWTGANCIGTGKVIGKGKEVREKYPVEMALAPENYSLVERDVNGVKTLHVVAPIDVDEIIKKGDEQ